MTKLTYHNDARAFGQFIKHGGDWKYASRVARWVEPSKGGRPVKNQEDLTGIEKVSGEQFSKTAGVSRPTVIKYLKAWDYCAERYGYIMSSKSIEAGEEIELPEELTPDLWVECYREANSKKAEETAPEPEAEETGSASESEPEESSEELTEQDELTELTAGLKKYTKKVQEFTPSDADLVESQIEAIEATIAALSEKLAALKGEAPRPRMRKLKELRTLKAV